MDDAALLFRVRADLMTQLRAELSGPAAFDWACRPPVFVAQAQGLAHLSSAAKAEAARGADAERVSSTKRRQIARSEIL